MAELLKVLGFACLLLSWAEFLKDGLRPKVLSVSHNDLRAVSPLYAKVYDESTRLSFFYS